MKSIGYEFKNKDLLKTALTHSSYANEHGEKSYERLEFLGDSILSFIISTYLYENHPELPEGDMSKIRAAIVCERSLESSCRNFGVEKYIILSRGEELTGGRERSSIIADVFEAILGAIYIDGGLECARKYVTNMLSKTVSDTVEGHGVFSDFKTKLQEIVQKYNSNVTYKLVGESGPEHEKEFTVEVIYCGKTLSKGRGKSKKIAEQDAAKTAIEVLKQYGKV